VHLLYLRGSKSEDVKAFNSMISKKEGVRSVRRGESVRT
jgi:hypothetical protein